jgi:septum formation protein
MRPADPARAHRAPPARTPASAPAFVWLASQSPRRAELLAQIQVAHRALLADEDEDAEALEAVRAGEAPQAYVERVVRAKLAAARARWRRRGGPVAPVLVADTTVALGRRILGKPADAAQAAAMLSALSGRTHRVITGVGIAWGPSLARTAYALQVSRVRFAPLTPLEIDAYVASGEPFGKAGGYGIQGRAAAFVAHIEGSHSSIMGLPLHETAVLLNRAGLPVGR